MQIPAEDGVADEQAEDRGDGEPGAEGKHVGFSHELEDDGPGDGDEGGEEEGDEDHGRAEDGSDAGHKMGVAHSHGFLVEAEGPADADKPDDAAAGEYSEDGAEEAGDPGQLRNVEGNPEGDPGAREGDDEEPEFLGDFAADEGGGDFFHDFIGDIELTGIARKDADEEDGDAADDGDERCGADGEGDPGDDAEGEEREGGDRGCADLRELGWRGEGFFLVACGIGGGAGLGICFLGFCDFSREAARDDFEEHEDVGEDETDGRARDGAGKPPAIAEVDSGHGGAVDEERANEAEDHDEVRDGKRNDEEVGIDGGSREQSGDEDEVECEGGEVVAAVEEPLVLDGPVSEEVGEVEADEEDCGAQLDEGVADGDGSFAIRAAGLEGEPTEDWDVLIPMDSGVADGAVGGGPRERHGAALVVEQNFPPAVGEPPDDDIEEAADAGTYGEDEDGERNNDLWVHVRGIMGEAAF